MKRFFFWVCLLFFLGFGAGAQDLKVAIGSGLTGCDLKNENMSPLTYFGIGFQAHTGVIYEGKKFFHEMNSYLGGVSTINLLARPETLLRLFAWDSDYSCLFKLKEADKSNLTLHLGGALTQRFALRNHQRYSNNNVDTDYAISLALAGMATYSVSLKKHTAAVQWKLMLPVLSVANAPSYVGRSPEGFIMNEEVNPLFLFQNSEIVSWGRFFRMVSDLSLVWTLANGNAFFAKYHWDFTQNRMGHYLADAKHYMSVGLLVRLN